MQHLSEIISCIALLVSVLAFLENRRNNRIGHAPAIIGSEHEGPTDYSYSIQNKGRGAAYFEKVEYFFDEKPMRDTSLREALTGVLAENNIQYDLMVCHPAQENVMQAGEELTLIKVTVPAQEAAKLKAIPSSRFAIKIAF